MTGSVGGRRLRPSWENSAARLGKAAKYRRAAVPSTPSNDGKPTVSTAAAARRCSATTVRVTSPRALRRRSVRQFAIFPATMRWARPDSLRACSAVWRRRSSTYLDGWPTANPRSQPPAVIHSTGMSRMNSSCSAWVLTCTRPNTTSCATSIRRTDASVALSREVTSSRPLRNPTEEPASVT